MDQKIGLPNGNGEAFDSICRFGFDEPTRADIVAQEEQPRPCAVKSDMVSDQFLISVDIILPAKPVAIENENSEGRVKHS